jgi:hypothetical protein
MGALAVGTGLSSAGTEALAEHWLPGPGLGIAVVRLALAVAVGGVVTVGGAHALKIPEARALAARLRRMARRRDGA